MQSITPASKQVFAKEEAKQTQTGGFIVREDSAEKPLAAEVISVGRDIDWIKPTDTIVYKPYATTEFKLNGEDYILIHEEDILGLITDV